MSQWVETELAESQLHDARHTKRLAQLLERLSEQAVSSIPRACHGWAETVAAYRFLDNPQVGLAEILSGHQQATLERLKAQPVALLVQDTTFLNYGTLHPKPGGDGEGEDPGGVSAPSDGCLYAGAGEPGRLGAADVAAAGGARSAGAESQPD